MQNDGVRILVRIRIKFHKIGYKAMAPKVIKAAEKKAKAKAKPKQAPGRSLMLFLWDEEEDEFEPITCKNGMTACEFLEVWAEQNGFSAVSAVPGGLTLRTFWSGEVIAFDTILSLVLLPRTRVYVEINTANINEGGTP